MRPDHLVVNIAWKASTSATVCARGASWYSHCIGRWQVQNERWALWPDAQYWRIADDDNEVTLGSVEEVKLTINYSAPTGGSVIVMDTGGSDWTKFTNFCTLLLATVTALQRGCRRESEAISERVVWRDEMATSTINNSLDLVLLKPCSDHHNSTQLSSTNSAGQLCSKLQPLQLQPQ